MPGLLTFDDNLPADRQRFGWPTAEEQVSSKIEMGISGPRPIDDLGAARTSAPRAAA